MGYLVNNGYKNGAINGLTTGLIGGLILGILIYFIQMTPILAYTGIKAILSTVTFA